MDRLLDLVTGHRRISIVGMCKNAGKTTALNRLISECVSGGIAAALFSVGRDGEKRDVITNLEKPGIYVEAGTMFATTSGLLEFCEARWELLFATGARTPLGEVLVLRARSGGFVELSGPSMNAGIPELTEALFSRGAEMILIDGAMSRIASASPAVAGCSILCTGADYDPDLRKVVEDTAHTAQLLSTPGLRDGRVSALLDSQSGKDVVFIDSGYNMAIAVGKENLNDPDAVPAAYFSNAAFVYFPGALTDSVCSAALRRLAPAIRSRSPDPAVQFPWSNLSGRDNQPVSKTGFDIIADDASKLMISRKMKALLETAGVKIYTRDPIKLSCVCVNPHCTTGPDLNKARFLREMREAVETPVVNVAEYGE